MRGVVAHDLSHFVGHGAGTMFAIILLNASIIGAAAVTLSTSYAFGDVFGARHSLHRGWREAKFFYGTFSGMVALAAGLVLIPRAPLASSQRESRPLPGCSCRVRPSFCCCSATTRMSSDRG